MVGAWAWSSCDPGGSPARHRAGGAATNRRACDRTRVRSSLSHDERFRQESTCGDEALAMCRRLDSAHGHRWPGGRSARRPLRFATAASYGSRARERTSWCCAARRVRRRSAWRGPMTARWPRHPRGSARSPTRRSVGSTAATLAFHAATDAARATSRRERTPSSERWPSPQGRSTLRRARRPTRQTVLAGCSL
jgi:hypothetical protein